MLERVAGEEERLAAFPPYATDARGLMVARGISFKVSHSATSHLTPIMFDTAGVATPLLERSLDSWEYAAQVLLSSPGGARRKSRRGVGPGAAPRRAARRFI